MKFINITSCILALLCIIITVGRVVYLSVANGCWYDLAFLFGCFLFARLTNMSKVKHDAKSKRYKKSL